MQKTHLKAEGSSKLITARTFSQKFSTRHVMRVGAVIWVKSKGKDYFGVFKSNTRPNRGTQLPGGRLERNENPGYGIVREVQEETGIKTKVVCPLGQVFYENPADNYSKVDLYYIVRPVKQISPFRKWHHTDRDKSKQDLECWFEPVDGNPDFLAVGQEQLIYMFRDWLEEHKHNKPMSNNDDGKKKKARATKNLE